MFPKAHRRNLSRTAPNAFIIFCQAEIGANLNCRHRHLLQRDNLSPRTRETRNRPNKLCNQFFRRSEMFKLKLSCLFFRNLSSRFWVYRNESFNCRGTRLRQVKKSACDGSWVFWARIWCPDKPPAREKLLTKLSERQLRLSSNRRANLNGKEAY